MSRTRVLTLFVAGLALAGIVAAPTVRADEARAKELFQLCAQCHGKQGGGNALFLAPNITGLDAWYVKRQLDKFRGGQRGLHFDDISGMRMRPMALSLRSEEDVALMADYVAKLPLQHPEPTLDGDPTKGKAYFGICATCHGPDAAGIEQQQGPRLNNASDWYLLTQLKHFRAGIRGRAEGDASGALMQPMSLTLPNDQAILDVIAYIRTLGK